MAATNDAARRPLPRRVTVRRVAAVKHDGGDSPICAMHAQAWLSDGPVLHLRLTDGLHGWSADLGRKTLGELAAASKFKAEKLDEYLRHTLESFANATTDFVLEQGALELTLAWSRVCVISNLREKIGGIAPVECLQGALGELRAGLGARLNAEMSAIAALVRSIDSIEAHARRARQITDEATARLASLEPTLVARFTAELNAKKRALVAARDAECDTDRGTDEDDVDDERAAVARSAAAGAPAAPHDGRSRADEGGREGLTGDSRRPAGTLEKAPLRATDMLDW
ncbi:hypothetical protein KFE25_010109 [Diacronema lutheri]|uniref:Uncharacterized protein n=1 Tax=Diacronema lutheri TaxID=2081491 RepID=A0A8J5XA71_DIALT|nr:hypothetical protein KFE25_010109 [Diacronema lutheri]